MREVNIPGYDHSASFSLGGSSEAGNLTSTIGEALGDKNVTLNRLFSNLQNMVNNHHWESIKPSTHHKGSADPRAMQISQIEAGKKTPQDLSNLFTKRHQFHYPILYYHKGRMMTKQEIGLYDDLTGNKHIHPSSPHSVERFFARNADPEDTAKLREEWKNTYGKLGNRMGLTTVERIFAEDSLQGQLPSRDYYESPPGEGIYKPPEDPIGYAETRDKITGELKLKGDNAANNIMGALIRRGPSAMKRHEGHMKKFEKFEKKIEEMREQGVVPWDIRSSFIPADSQTEDLIEKYGGPTQSEEGEDGRKGKQYNNSQFHPSLDEFNDVAELWLRPTLENLDDPEGYREPTDEIPYHRKLHHDIEQHMVREWQEVLKSRALDYFINTINPDTEEFMYPTGEDTVEPLTAERVRQIRLSQEKEGGDPKEWMKIEHRIGEAKHDNGKWTFTGLISEHKKKDKHEWNFGGDTLKRKDFFENRSNQVEDVDDIQYDEKTGQVISPPRIDWSQYEDIPEGQRDAWNGLLYKAGNYFRNYDKRPQLARDKELVSFANTVHDSLLFPGPSMETMFARNGIHNHTQFKQKMEKDEDFKKEYEMVSALISVQIPSWSPAPSNMREHIDTLSHISGMRNNTWYPGIRRQEEQTPEQRLAPPKKFTGLPDKPMRTHEQQQQIVNVVATPYQQQQAPIQPPYPQQQYTSTEEELDPYWTG